MKRSIRLAGMLFALFTSVAAVPAAHAIPDPLWTTGAGPLQQLVTPDSWDTWNSSLQPLANFRVSAATTIGGFGVWGRADSASASSPVLVNWALFEEGAFNSAYWFQQTVTSSGARWFDSVGAPVTLAAGKTYQMGLVTNASTFSWGLSEPGVEVEGSSGKILTTMGTTYVILSGGAGSGFQGLDPVDVYSPYPDMQPSLRIYGTDYISGNLPPVPEPSEWAMLLAGLMVVAFVAKRQRRSSI